MIKILHTYGPCLPLYLWWDVCLSMGINDCTYIFYIYFMQGNWIKMWYIMWVNIIFKVTGEILPGIQIEFKIYPIWIGDYLFFGFCVFCLIEVQPLDRAGSLLGILYILYIHRHHFCNGWFFPDLFGSTL